MAKPYLFIDRDGTLIYEVPDGKINAFDRLTFYPGALYYMAKIASELNYELVVISNQDGLGAEDFPEGPFNEVNDFIFKTFENEGVTFKEILFDRSYKKDNEHTRKPNPGLLLHYMNNPDVDMENSFVVGDRITDVMLAKNLGCKGIWINNGENLGAAELADTAAELQDFIALDTTSWESIYAFLASKKKQ